jgi:Fe-S-cluster containining protein
MFPLNWQKTSKEQQKAYKRLLDKTNQPGGRQLRNKILADLPALHEETFAKIDCLQCANCCKNHSPRFKQPDIKRIARRLRIKEGELIHQHLRLDQEGDYVTKTSPCPFLAEDNTCNIYEDRPSDCARYPYTDEDVLLKRVTLTLKNATVCPATFVILEKLLEAQPVLKQE